MLSQRQRSSSVSVRVMALDIGQTRVGVAISDPQGRVATPLCVLPFQEVFDSSRSFRNLLEDWEPEALVCGLPLTLAGEDGPQTQKIKEQAQHIAKSCALPLYYADERLSSKEAKRILREQGYDERSMRGKVDMIAASVFLQYWLDANGGYSD